MAANKILLPLVLFLAGIAIGMVLHEQSTANANETVSLLGQDNDALNQLCQNSSVIKSLTVNEAAKRQEFLVSSIAATPIADRGLLCQVQGKLNRTLSGGRYSETTTERLVFVSASTGEAEEVNYDQFQFLQQSPVVKTLASNNPGQEPQQ